MKLAGRSFYGKSQRNLRGYLSQSKYNDCGIFLITKLALTNHLERITGESMEHNEKVNIKFDLNFTYSGASQMALQNVSGSIEKGRCIVLCGASGCGKSTLLRCINRLVPDFYDGDFNGICYINGRDTAPLSIGEVGEFAASVFQEPFCNQHYLPQPVTYY